MVAVTWSAWVWFFRGGFWSCCWPVSPAGRSSSTRNPSCLLFDRVQKWPGQFNNPQRSSGVLYTWKRHIATILLSFYFSFFKLKDTFTKGQLVCNQSKHTSALKHLTSTNNKSGEQNKNNKRMNNILTLHSSFKSTISARTNNHLFSTNMFLIE